MKKINGFPGYFVDEMGNVYSSHGKQSSVKMLSPFFDSKKRYQMIKLKDEAGKYRHVLVHRAVAEAFIPNPNGYPEINHKNNNPADNRVENLEWCTRAQNVHLTYAKMGPVRNYRRCKLYNNEALVGEFQSLTEATKKAEELFGVNGSSLAKYLFCGSVKIVLDDSNALNNDYEAEHRVINKAPIHLYKDGNEVFVCNSFIALSSYMKAEYNISVSAKMLAYVYRKQKIWNGFIIKRFA